MALRGSIEDFGLADILQLIAKGVKTGTLVLRNDLDEIRACFRSGWVVAVETESRPADSVLGLRLRKAGLLSHAQLGKALKLRADSGAPLAQILVETGMVRPEVAAHHASVLATDTLFEVFTWGSGSYEWHDRVLHAGRELAEPLNGEQILMQGIVLVDEWPVITRRIPASTWIIERRWALPPEQGMDEAPIFGGDLGAPHLDGEIGSNERLVHDLCVPGVDVQTIIDRAPFHRFEACRCLSVLIGAHFVRLTEPFEDSDRTLS